MNANKRSRDEAEHYAYGRGTNIGKQIMETKLSEEQLKAIQTQIELINGFTTDCANAFDNERKACYAQLANTSHCTLDLASLLHCESNVYRWLSIDSIHIVNTLLPFCVLRGECKLVEPAFIDTVQLIAEDGELLFLQGRANTTSTHVSENGQFVQSTTYDLQYSHQESSIRVSREVGQHLSVGDVILIHPLLEVQCSRMSKSNHNNNSNSENESNDSCNTDKEEKSEEPSILIERNVTFLTFNQPILAQQTDIDVWQQTVHANIQHTQNWMTRLLAQPFGLAQMTTIYHELIGMTNTTLPIATLSSSTAVCNKTELTNTQPTMECANGWTRSLHLPLLRLPESFFYLHSHPPQQQAHLESTVERTLQELSECIVITLRLYLLIFHTAHTLMPSFALIDYLHKVFILSPLFIDGCTTVLPEVIASVGASNAKINYTSNDSSENSNNSFDSNSSKMLLEIATDIFAQVRESLDWLLMQQTDNMNIHTCDLMCSESVWLNEKSRYTCDVLKFILAKWSKMWLAHRRVVLLSAGSSNQTFTDGKKINDKKMDNSDKIQNENKTSHSSPLFIIDSPEHAVYYYWTFACFDKYNDYREITFTKENINATNSNRKTKETESELEAQQVIFSLEQFVHWLQKSNDSTEHDMSLSSSSPTPTSPMERKRNQTGNHHKNNPFVYRTSMYWSKHMEDVLQFCQQPPTLALILESVNKNKALVNTRNNHNDDDDNGSTGNEDKKNNRDIFAEEAHYNEMCLLQETYYPHLTSNVEKFYLHALRLAYIELYGPVVNAIRQTLIFVDDAVKQHSEQAEEDTVNNNNVNEAHWEEGEKEKDRAMPWHTAFEKAAEVQQNICTLRVKEILQTAFAPFDSLENKQRQQMCQEEKQEKDNEKEQCAVQQSEELSSLWEIRHCALFGCPVEVRAIVKASQLAQHTPKGKLNIYNDNNEAHNSLLVHTNNISRFAYLLVVLQGNKYLFPLVITRFTFEEGDNHISNSNKIYSQRSNSQESKETETKLTDWSEVRITAHVLKENDLLVDFVEASAALSEDGMANAWVVMDAESSLFSLFALQEERVVTVLGGGNVNHVKSRKSSINSIKRLLPRSTPALTYFYTIERLHHLITSQTLCNHIKTNYYNNSNSNEMYKKNNNYSSKNGNVIDTSNIQEWWNELYKTKTRNYFCNEPFSVDASVQAILEGRATSVTDFSSSDNKSETAKSNFIINSSNITAESIIDTLLNMSTSYNENNQNNNTECEKMQFNATWRLNATQLEVLHTLCTLTLHYSENNQQSQREHLFAPILDVLAVVEGVEGSGKSTVLQLTGKVRGVLHSAARTQHQLISKGELKSTAQRLRKTINMLSKHNNTDVIRATDHTSTINTHYLDNSKWNMSPYKEIVQHACESASVQVQVQKGLQYCGTPLLLSESVEFSNNNNAGRSSLETNTSCKSQSRLSSEQNTCTPQFAQMQNLLLESYKRCRASPLQQNLTSLLRYLSSVAEMYTSLWPHEGENNSVDDDDEEHSETSSTHSPQNNIHNTLFSSFLSFLMSSRDVAETRHAAANLITCTLKEAADNDTSKCSTWYDYMSRVIWQNCNMSSSFAHNNNNSCTNTCESNKKDKRNKEQWKEGQEYWLHRMAPATDSMCAVTMPEITHLTTMHVDQTKAWFKIYIRAQRELLLHIQLHTHACIQHVCLCLVELIDNIAAIAQSLRYSYITNSFHDLVQHAQLPLLCKWAPLHLLIDDVRFIPDFVWWQFSVPFTVICTHSMHEPLLLQTQPSLLSTLLLTSSVNTYSNNNNVNYKHNKSVNSVNKFNSKVIAKSVTRMQLRRNERSLRHELKHLLHLFCRSFDSSTTNKETKQSTSGDNSNNNNNSEEKEEKEKEEENVELGNDNEEETSLNGCTLRGLVSQSAVEVWTHVVPWELNVQADVTASIFVCKYLRSYAKSSHDRIQVYVPFERDLNMHREIVANRLNLEWPFVAEHQVEEKQIVLSNDVMPICVPFDYVTTPTITKSNNSSIKCTDNSISYSCSISSDNNSCANKCKEETKCNEVNVAIICLSSLLDYLHEQITHRTSLHKHKEKWPREHPHNKVHEHMQESTTNKTMLSSSSSSSSRLSARERWSNWMEHHSETINNFVHKLQLWLWQIIKQTRSGVVFIGSKELFRYVSLLEQIEIYVHKQRIRSVVNESVNADGSDVDSTSTKEVKTKTKSEAALQRYWLSHFAESAVLALRCASHAKCCRTATIVHSASNNSTETNVTNRYNIDVTTDTKVDVILRGPAECKSLCLQPFDHCRRAGHVCIEPCHEIQPIKANSDNNESMKTLVNSGNTNSAVTTCKNKSCNDVEKTTIITRHAKCPYPCCKMLPCHHICHRTCGSVCTPCLFVGLHELSCGQRVVRGMGPGNVIEYAFFAHFVQSPCLAHLRDTDGSYRALISCDLPVSVRCPRCGTKSKVPCAVYTTFENKEEVVEYVEKANNENTTRQLRGEQSPIKTSTQYNHEEEEELSESKHQQQKNRFILADGACAGCVHVYNSVASKANLELLPLPPTTYTLHNFTPEVETAVNNKYNYSILQKRLPRHLLPEEVRRALDAAFVLAHKKAHLMLMKEALELSSHRANTSQDKPTSEFAMYKAEYEANKLKQASELQKWNTEVNGSVAEWGTRLRQALDVQMNLNEELEAILPLLNSEAETEGVRQRYVTN